MLRFLALGLALLPALAHAETIAALGGGKLIKFDSASPAETQLVTLTGDVAGLATLDVMPTGERTLYGIALYGGVGGTTARMHSIDPDTGVMTLLHLGYMAFETTSGNIGFEAIPSYNLGAYFRGIGAEGKHWVFNQYGGGGVESSQPPTFVTGDTNEGQIPSLHALAYDHNANGSGAPTLFGVDVPRAVLVRIGSVGGSPDGAASGKLTTVGSLGVSLAASSTVHFDISGATGVAYATLQTASGTGLYTINLATGAATLVGLIGDGSTVLYGMAVVPDPPPAPATTASEGGGGAFGALGLLLALLGRRAGQERSRCARGPARVT